MNFTITPEKATILIPVPEIAIPRTVVEYAENNGYHIKPEFHVTLVSFQNGKKILRALTENPDIAFGDIVKLAESFQWGIIFNTEYFVLERTIQEFVLHGHVQTPEHTRRSIIQKVSIPDMASFFNELEKITGIQFDNPVEHITLYSWSDYEPELFSGIALNSEADFEKYKKAQIS